MKTNCVTKLQKESIEYKAAMQRFNMTSGDLELILQEYQSLPENQEAFSKGELLFPSDEYLQEHFYAPVSTVTDSKVIDFWDKQYSSPIITNTYEEAATAQKEASKYFDPKSMIIKETNDGKYQLLVSRPKMDYSEEGNQILKNAKRDEQGRLLAPNGKVSNLNERQYVQVRTKAFKNWFGDWENDPTNASKVVDENGEPLVVYHTRNAFMKDFDTFDTNVEDRPTAIYATNDKVMSSSYWKMGYDRDDFFKFATFVTFIREDVKKELFDPFTGEKIESINPDYTDLLKMLSKLGLKYDTNKKIFTIEELKQIRNTIEEKYKLEDLKILFLNIKNPVIIEGNHHYWNDILFNGKQMSTRSIEELFRNSEHDGIIFKNIKDWGTSNNINTAANVYAMYSPNQVKSAESNTGTFSINNDNIYYNLQQSKSPKDTIYEILRKEGLIHRWGNGDKYMLTLKADTSYGSNDDLNSVTREQLVNRAFDRVKARLEELGLPADLIEKKNSYSQGTAFVTINEDKITKIKDAIDAGAKLGDIKAIYDLTDFLSNKFGVEFGGIITAKKANEMTGGMNANAFISHNKVYVVANKVTVDTVAEEFLHPFVNTIYKQTPEKFNELYKEACELFPNLKLQIENAYGKNKKRLFTKEDLRQELVTQALSRNFREEYEKSLKEGKLTTEETLKRMDKVTEFFTKFWNYIKDLLASIKDRTYNNAVNFTVEELQEFSLNELAKIINAKDSAFLIEHNDKTRFNINDEIEWSRQSANGYEVSTAGDSRFSALKATFKKGTIIDGVDVSGMTIEDVYQKVIKKSKKGQPPAKDSKLYNQDSNLSKEELEDMSYEKGYLPLWQEWAKQNPDLIEDLRQKAAGKVLTDKFANTKVSQARALAEILNQSATENTQEEINIQKNNSNIEFYSGAAKGADTIWKQEAEKLGYNVKDYTPADMDALDNDTRAEIEVQYLSTVMFLGRKVLAAETHTGKLVRRDMLQVNGADAVFAISSIDENNRVNGGTGYATSRGIMLGLPVYVYDQNTSKWNKWDYNTNKFVEIEEPTLTPHAATVGSRAIQQNGIEAIKSILKKPVKAVQKEVSNEDTVKEKETTHPIDSLTQKINNITSIDSPVSATEANELARKIAYKLSDILTEVQNDPELAETVTGGLVKAKDITDEDLADRMKLLQKLGIRRVLNFCRDEVFSYEYDDETGEGRNPYITEEMFDKADLLYDNFDALVQLGIAEFASVEGFGIKLDSEGNVKAEEVDNNEIDANENDKETAIENGENTQESWQVDTNTIDVVQSMSQIVKRALMQCYRMNPDGSFQINDWGLYDRIDIRETTNSILKWVQGSVNYKTMVEKLVKQSEKNPWLKQILPRLLDESGNETVFQSQFYGVMMKHQQLYDVIRTKDGEISSVPVNSTPALTDAKRTIASKFKMGNHPLFDSTGKVNQKTKQDLLEVKDELEQKTYSEETRESIVQNIHKAINYLGYDVDINSVDAVVDKQMFKNATDILGYIYKDLETHQNDTEWEPFSTNSKKNGILNNIGRLIKPITDNIENLIPSSFYTNGKMYQTYITPSYMTKMFQNFKLPNEIDMSNPNEATPFNAWLEKEFGMTEWFKQTPNPNSINANERATQGWRNLWLRELATNPNAAKIIAHKVNLNYNGNSYMNNKSGRAMSPAEYTLSIITEYFRETTDNKESKVPAWFRVPMMSNKPSSEFIKFFSYRGANYKSEILNGMMMVFNQELSRIQTVILRNETYGKGSDALIKNFDTKRGKEFCFLDFLEKYRKDKKGNLTEFGKLIDDKVNGKEINEAKLLEMAKELITQELNEEVQRTLKKWESNGVLKAAEKIQGIDKAHVKEDLENFILNDALANMNMTQLLITDKAYYKNTEDEQKRMAQVHAPGIRPNVDALDFSGKRVSDGIFRTIILKDFDKYKSNIIDNLRVVFDKKLERLDKNSKQYALQKEVYDNILKLYEEINVADAEGYSSPTSLRKKMYMFGKWNKHHEEIYQKIRSGKYDYKDLEFAFQPLKPFVFSSSMVSSRVDDAPIKTMKVNYQYKNSEYLLMMADAIIRNENTGKPNLLKVLYDVMESSASTMGKDKCIDTIQFESTTKTGLSAPIDLSLYIDDKDGEANAKALIEGLIYQDDDKKAYNTVYVKESDFSDYCIQQEVPEHFKDHTQAHGSQIRMITPSDLNPDALYRVEDRNVSPAEFRNEYENTIAENIKESIKSLSDELHLTGTRYERNAALSNILKKEILSSPRYGVDLLLACSLDENGEFRIPLGDPIQSKRVEQLINSIVKNRVNKQKIAGGPVVQVSNFGTSRQLNIRFKDKDGNLLKTKEEFGGTQEEFETYIKENQNGIAYYEVFAPIYTDELLQFMDENGNIDVEAVEKTSPELLDIVTYRIPSEDKYSSAPCKIVGFMPREAGEGIMMPYEITEITGSDKH